MSEDTFLIATPVNPTEEQLDILVQVMNEWQEAMVQQQMLEELGYNDSQHREECPCDDCRFGSTTTLGLET